MNELKLFEQIDIPAIREYEMSKKEYDGYVYAVEAGEKVKIGSTTAPAQRIRALSTMFSNYAMEKIGRIAISRPHMNFRQNEIILHSVFESNRIKSGEMFSISFDDAVSEMRNLLFDTSDKERELMAKRDHETIEMFKRMMFGDSPLLQIKHSEPITHQKFEWKATVTEQSGCNAAAFLLRTALGEFVLNDNQRDDVFGMVADINSYEIANVSISFTFDCSGTNDEVYDDET